MVADDKSFDRIVRVCLEPGGKVRSVKTTREAADLLASVDWPGERDAAHRDALETCLKVLDGHRSTEEAQRVFTGLAKETGVLVESAEGKSKEDEASRMLFDRHLRIRSDDDANTVRTIRSVKGASEALIDWPHARRGPFYQSAREVVEAAMAGKATAAEAREAFAALVAHAGMLIEEGYWPRPEGNPA